MLPLALPLMAAATKLDSGSAINCKSFQLGGSAVTANSSTEYCVARGVNAAGPGSSFLYGKWMFAVKFNQVGTPATNIWQSSAQPLAVIGAIETRRAFPFTSAASPAANFTASFSGTTMSVSALSSGVIAKGQYVHASGIGTDPIITAGSGTTWTLSASFSLGSRASVSYGVTGLSAGVVGICSNGTSGDVYSNGTLALSGAVTATGLTSGGQSNAIAALVFDFDNSLFWAYDPARNEYNSDPTADPSQGLGGISFSGTTGPFYPFIALPFIAAWFSGSSAVQFMSTPNTTITNVGASAWNLLTLSGFLPKSLGGFVAGWASLLRPNQPVVNFVE